MKDGDVVTSMSMGDAIRGAMMMLAYQYGLCLYLGLICFFLRGGLLVFCTNLVLVCFFWCLSCLILWTKSGGRRVSPNFGLAWWVGGLKFTVIFAPNSHNTHKLLMEVLQSSRLRLQFNASTVVNARNDWRVGDNFWNLLQQAFRLQHTCQHLSGKH